MSPLDIAAFAAPISFIIAIFSGLSGMAVDAVTDLAIFSLVQVIMAAEAGAAAMEGAKRVVTAKIRRFIQISLESAGHSGSPKTNCCKLVSRRTIRFLRTLGRHPAVHVLWGCARLASMQEAINRRNGKSNVTIVIVSSHSIAFHLGG